MAGADDQDAPEPVFTSLKDRIAALNAANAKASGNGIAAPSPKPMAKAPARPPKPFKAAGLAANGGQQKDSNTTSNTTPVGSGEPKPPPPSKPRPQPPAPPRTGAPPLPKRQSHDQGPPVPTQPPLPSRPSNTRKGSSSASTLGDRRAIPPPPSGDAPVLSNRYPPLPNRNGSAKEAKEVKEAKVVTAAPPLPVRRDSSAPTLPPRKASADASQSAADASESDAHPPLPSRPPPLPATSKPVLRSEADAPSEGSEPAPGPPPIPLHSRPVVSTGAEPEPAHTPSPNPNPTGCLICRDFSSPDTVAAQHPSSTLPRSSPEAYLAEVLCAPFESPTDKARAIFTWCHYNITYDIDNFLRGTVPRQTVGDTIFTGQAVCEGYAKVFHSVAVAAGLQCQIVSGHGKGFGFVGGGIVPFDSNHAWNAVALEDGWKLIDPCWGAGAVENGVYTPKLDPKQFTMSNEDFGRRHFPGDGSFFVDSPPSWEEYITSWNAEDLPEMFLDPLDQGINPVTLEPASRQLHGTGAVRFLASKVCPHWNDHHSARLMLLIVHDQQGEMDALVPESDGYWWWWDVAVAACGRPGERVMLVVLDTFDGRDASNVNGAMFLTGKGRKGYSYKALAAWDIV